MKKYFTFVFVEASSSVSLSSHPSGSFRSLILRTYHTIYNLLPSSSRLLPLCLSTTIKGVQSLVEKSIWLYQFSSLVGGLLCYPPSVSVVVFKVSTFTFTVYTVLIYLRADVPISHKEGTHALSKFTTFGCSYLTILGWSLPLHRAGVYSRIAIHRC